MSYFSSKNFQKRYQISYLSSKKIRSNAKFRISRQKFPETVKTHSKVREIIPFVILPREYF